MINDNNLKLSTNLENRMAVEREQLFIQRGNCLPDHTGISKENEKTLNSNELYVKSDECHSSARTAVKVKEETRKYNCLRAIVNSSISSVNEEVYKKSIKMDIKKYLFLCSFCV